MSYYQIKIHGKNLTTEHLQSGVVLFYPSYNSSISRIEEDLFHMPYTSGTHTLKQALEWINQQGYFWIGGEQEKLQEMLREPLWEKASWLHTSAYFDLFQEPNEVKCVCCDGLIGYSSNDICVRFDMICSYCKNNCYKKENCQICKG